MEQIVRCCMPIILAFIIPVISNGQKRLNNTPMHESYIVIKETKDDIKYLTNILKYNNETEESDPGSEDKNFLLSFDINTRSKTVSDLTTNAQYTMQVIKENGIFDMQLRLESKTFYENGENMGHVHPTGNWYTDDKLSELVLNYYFSHKEIIPVFTQNIDISHWEPLFELYKNPGNQAHVLKISLIRLYPETRQFELDCELLSFSNVLINGKLLNYSISTHTFLFNQRGKEYYVKTKHTSTKTYTNGGKDITELTVSNQFEALRPVNGNEFSKKILTYYFNHKAELESSLDNK